MSMLYRLWNSILLNLEDDGGAKYDRIQEKGIVAKGDLINEI